MSRKLTDFILRQVNTFNSFDLLTEVTGYRNFQDPVTSFVLIFQGLMTKVFPYFLIFMVLFGCNKETPEPTPVVSIEISSEKLDVTYEASVQTLSVTTNCDWGVASSESWCTVSPSGGISGTTTLQVKIASNEGKESRTAILTFKSGSYKKEITVTQNFLLKEVGFTDNAFKAYCKQNFDTNSDGIVSLEEAALVTTINVQGLGISSMDGIESFTSLQTLNCSNNSISKLELSTLKKLVSLDCSKNQISELDIHSNTDLETFNCTSNPSLTTIHVWTGFTPTSSFQKPDGASYVEPEIPTPAGYELVWQDEFNDSRDANGKAALPNSAEWWYETGNGGWGNNELENYIPAISGTDTCAKISDGTLKIIAQKSGSEVLSVRMNTSESWTYGYFEARLKLPVGKGTWPAFWMMPKNFTSWPGDGEIDIMEEVGYRPNWVSTTIHCTAYSTLNGQQKSAETYVSTAQTKFHVYAVEWTSDYIKGYVDGKLFYEFDNDHKGNNDTWPFNNPFYLKLNLAWGGNWGGAQGVDESVLPATYEIDYIRVFQK